MILHRHEQLGSTNDEALRLAREGAPHWTVVTAGQQTAGRGRQGRAWVSPPGNLLVSFLFRTTVWRGFTQARAAEIGFVAALSVADALDVYGAGAALKWPNDVLLGGAKTAGILTEMVGDAVIIGIGINVAHAPPGMPYAVTSLAAQGITITADDMLHALAAMLEQRLSEWDSLGFTPIRAAWIARGPALGQVLTARLGASMVTGGFAGLAEDGALLLTTADGTTRIVAGEVVAA